MTTEIHIINRSSRGRYSYYPGCALSKEILKTGHTRSCFTMDDIARFVGVGLKITYGGDVDRALDMLKIPYTGQENTEVTRGYIRGQKGDSSRVNRSV